jgi:hypothetical protein
LSSVTQSADGLRRPIATAAHGRSAAPPVYNRRVVLFFEALLILASILIAWFSLYVVYRLVTDES